MVTARLAEWRTPCGIRHAPAVSLQRLHTLRQARPTLNLLAHRGRPVGRVCQQAADRLGPVVRVCGHRESGEAAGLAGCSARRVRRAEGVVVGVVSGAQRQERMSLVCVVSRTDEYVAAFHADIRFDGPLRAPAGNTGSAVRRHVTALRQTLPARVCRIGRRDGEFCTRPDRQRIPRLSGILYRREVTVTPVVALIRPDVARCHDDEACGIGLGCTEQLDSARRAADVGTARDSVDRRRPQRRFASRPLRLSRDRQAIRTPASRRRDLRLGHSLGRYEAVGRGVVRRSAGVR